MILICVNMRHNLPQSFFAVSCHLTVTYTSTFGSNPRGDNTSRRQGFDEHVGFSFQLHRWFNTFMSFMSVFVDHRAPDSCSTQWESLVRIQSNQLVIQIYLVPKELNLIAFKNTCHLLSGLQQNPAFLPDFLPYDMIQVAIPVVI